MITIVRGSEFPDIRELAWFWGPNPEDNEERNNQRQNAWLQFPLTKERSLASDVRIDSPTFRLTQSVQVSLEPSQSRISRRAPSKIRVVIDPLTSPPGRVCGARASVSSPSFCGAGILSSSSFADSSAPWDPEPTDSESLRSASNTPRAPACPSGSGKPGYWSSGPAGRQ